MKDATTSARPSVPAPGAPTWLRASVWEAGAAAVLRFVVILALLVLCAPRCGAQDFVAPVQAGPAAAPLALLDRALPSPAAGVALSGSSTRWFALPELTTRALALGASWHGARAALGLSQTGVPTVRTLSFSFSPAARPPKQSPHPVMTSSANNGFIAASSEKR